MFEIGVLRSFVSSKGWVVGRACPQTQLYKSNPKNLCRYWIYLPALALFYVACGQAANGRNDLNLELLLQKSLASHPMVLSAGARKEAASTELTAAKLRFLPSPSVNTQRNQVQFNGGVNGGAMPSTNVAISQPLWMGGGLIAGYDKADARLSAADVMLLEAREDIARRLITAYFDWRKAYAKIQALDESVRLHERLVGLISRRNEYGVAAGVDKDLGISRLNQAQADLDTQKSAEEIALTTISEIVGEPITRRDLISSITKNTKIPNKSIGLSKALENSTLIQRYKFEADAADAEAREIRAQSLPQLSFQAQRQIGNAYYPGVQGFNTLGLVVSFAPGGGFSSAVAGSAAMDRARASSYQVEVVRRDFSDRLNAEYSEYESSLLKKESLLKAASLTGDISASYDRQYLVGRKNWLDLMNSIRERSQAMVQLADVDAALASTSWRLLIYIDGTAQFQYSE